MLETKNYIVQYIGFKTNLTPKDFISRWTPFASNFKNIGIQSIDLYKVQDNKDLTFISRNIWTSEIYFENFPSGVASSASGGGISLTQLGGYWIDKSDLQAPKLMSLIFSKDNITQDLEYKEKLQCTIYVKYLKAIEFIDAKESIASKKSLFCTHLKTI